MRRAGGILKGHCTKGGFLAKSLFPRKNPRSEFFASNVLRAMAGASA